MMLINQEAYEIALTFEGKMNEIPGPKDNPLIVLAHQCTTLKADDDETANCSSAMNLFHVLACIKRNPFLAYEMLQKYKVPELVCVELFRQASVNFDARLKARSIDRLIIAPTWKANARSWLTWGVSVLNNPQEGDICVYKRGSSKVFGHVAFFKRYRWAKTFIQSYGANQGDKLCFANYPKTNLLDIRRGTL